MHQWQSLPAHCSKLGSVVATTGVAALVIPTMMKRVVITGSSGYLGGRLVERLSRTDGVTILGIDIHEPKGFRPHEFVKLDVRSPDLVSAIEAFQPDTIVHLAFVLQPMRDEKKMREINVVGCQNVLAAAQAAQPARLMVSSSATAFGAWPDNPVPMDDVWPLRARREFQYASDKVDIEELLVDFQQQQTTMEVSWVRPTVICGPHMNNYLSRFLFGMPFMVLIDGKDVPVQFVHEDDVVEAMCQIMEQGGSGAYNVAPPDWLHVSDLARETNRRAIRAPFWLVKTLAAIAWKCRLSIHEYPPGFLYFARYPWIVASTRLQDEIGFQFQFSSLDALRSVTKKSD